MSLSAGEIAWKISFELSPIILTGGIAAQMPGGVIPIILLTEALSFVGGILAGPVDIDLDDFFAHFMPLPGGQLIKQQIPHYPLANQAIAANAVIADPLPIPVRMVCPAKGELGWALKLATMTALQASFKLHNASGGTYTIATPSVFYTNCLMVDMTDVSSGESKQPQNTYQIDFEQPLLTLQDAQQAQNSLMQQLTNATQTTNQGTWAGTAPTVGNPASLGAVGTVPAATSPAGVQSQAPTGVFGP